MSRLARLRKLVSSTEWLLVFFLAGLFVILESQHVFILLDESALNLIRISRVFQHQGVETVQATTGPAACADSRSRYTVVLLPAGSEGSSEVAAADQKALWLRTAVTIRRADPRVIALDLDMSREQTRPENVLASINAFAGEGTRTRLATIAIPVPKDDSDARERRTARNKWLRGFCAAAGDSAVAIASPLVERSHVSNSAVQFWSQRVVALREIAPPAYPTLGQTAKLLGDGLDATDPILGPGALCDYLKGTDADERLPFVEEPDPNDLAETSNPLFQVDRHAGELFSLEWINPYRVARDIPVVSVQTEQDFKALDGPTATACFKNKIVFVGRRPTASGLDSFPTIVSDATPGVMIHAMVARSTETGLRSARAVNAGVDFIVGYFLIFFGKFVSFPDFARSPSFTLRLIARIGRLAAPLLVIVLVLVLSLVALTVGFFLNPLVVFLGMWLHAFLESFLHKQGDEFVGPPVALRYPVLRKISKFVTVPRLASSGRLNLADRLVYGVSLCCVLSVIAYALVLVKMRLSITPL